MSAAVVDGGAQLLGSLGTLAALVALLGAEDLEEARSTLVVTASFLWVTAGLGRAVRFIALSRGQVSALSAGLAGALVQVTRISTTACLLAGLAHVLLTSEVPTGVGLLVVALGLRMLLPAFDIAGAAVVASGREWVELPRALSISLGPAGWLAGVVRVALSVASMAVTLATLVALLSGALVAVLMLLPLIWGLGLLGVLQWEKEQRRVARELAA
ncbi:MAG: hypothetical protein AB2A00_22845 [Myxococcota bacterium]